MTTSPSRTRPTPPAAAVWPAPWWWRRSSAPPPKRNGRWRCSGNSATKSTAARAPWAWRSLPARCRPRASRRSNWAGTRSRWAWAFTANTAADDIAGEMMTAITGDLGAEPGSEVLLLVNGYGGTPAMELYLMFDAAKRVLDARGLKVAR